MRSGLISATLAVVASVAAIPSPQVMPNSRLTDSLKHTLEQSASDLVTDIVNGVAPALPLDAFNTPYTHEPVPLEEAKKNLANYKLSMAPPAHADPPKKRQSAAKCGSLRIRREWDNLDDNGKQSFINAVKCLMSRPPSGKFSQAKSRYEDLVALHQTLTPQWHGNAMFPAAHRAFLFLTETMLRNECGYTGNLPWFDEARHAGSFASSSLFSTKWLGSLAINGQCVRDGQFANTVLNVGPGSSNVIHCLSRKGDGSLTKNCNQEYQNICNNYPDFNGMNNCMMNGWHGFCHNGVGGVMADVQASMGEIFFLFHHGAVDRAVRRFHFLHPEWLTKINGVDANNNPVTLDSVVSTMGMMNDMRVRDLLDTENPTLCYKYDY